MHVSASVVAKTVIADLLESTTDMTVLGKSTMASGEVSRFTDMQSKKIALTDQ